MRILIITPAFRERERLPRLIASLREQEHSDWVLFVRDNHSDDATAQFLKDWSKRDSRISYNVAEKQSSAADNWRNAVDEAVMRHDSDAVMFIAGDDYLEPRTALSTLTHELISGEAKVVSPYFVSRDHKAGIDKPIVEFSPLVQSSRARRAILMSDWVHCHLLYSLFLRETFIGLFSSRSQVFQNGANSDWLISAKISLDTRIKLASSSGAVYVRDHRERSPHEWIASQTGSSIAKSSKRSREIVEILRSLIWPITASSIPIREGWKNAPLFLLVTLPCLFIRRLAAALARLQVQFQKLIQDQ